MELNEKIVRLAFQLVSRRKIEKAPRFTTLLLGSDVVPIWEIEAELMEAHGQPRAATANLPALRRASAVDRALAAFGHDHDFIVKTVLHVLMANERPGYTGLARLIERGYFDLILTADFGFGLETALGSEGVGPHMYRTCPHPLFDATRLLQVVDRKIPSLRIIKLYGDLYQDEFAFTRNKVKTFNAALKPMLAQSLSRPVLVVGYDGERDDWPFSDVSTNLYYVNRIDPQPAWPIFGVLQGADDIQLITGPDASFDSFFTQLSERVLGSEKTGEPGFEQVEEALQNDGIDVTDDAVRRITAGENAGRVLIELQEDGLVERVERTVFTIRYDGVEKLEFRVDGDLNYASKKPATVRVAVADLNRQMQNMGLQITEAHGSSGSDQSRSMWREMARREGQRFHGDLFNSYPELMQMLGVAQGRMHGENRDENLYFCFEGARDHLGLPYELLFDTAPLAIRHPIFRKVAGVTGAGDRSFSRLLSDLRISNTPLRVLLIASDTLGLNVDQEVSELAGLLDEQAKARNTRIDINVMLTAEASLGNVTELLRAHQHHVVHYAGHSTFTPNAAERSSLYFWTQPQRSGGVSALTALQLGELMRGSPTRLFYLNSCVGAAVGDAHQLVYQDYLGLLDALVVNAEVPIVLGYRWYVTDEGARTFAKCFYTGLFETQCPARAALYARREVRARDPNDETWTSPILVAQDL